MSKDDQTHLTLEDRRTILEGIKKGASYVAIGQTVGKDASTIAKEIRLHKTKSGDCRYPLDCENSKICPYDHSCIKECDMYEPYYCKRRDRTPGACDGCPSYNGCRHTRYKYNPEQADKDYRDNLSESRSGVNMTQSQLQHICNVVGPLLRQGLSPYDIVTAHPELHICEKTLYNYLENDVFRNCVDPPTVTDLRRQTGRRNAYSAVKKQHKSKPRRVLASYLGRTYKDYENYMRENEDVSVVQMDTVYNNASTGPFIQTFLFLKTGFFFAIYHTDITAEGMVSGIDVLEKLLGTQLFREHVNVILTDRGSEFCSADKIEHSFDGTQRTRVFYCDPMRSNQKGNLENKHIQLRYIMAKQKDLEKLGLTSQEDLNLAISNINSKPLKQLGGRCSYEYAAFLYPEFIDKMKEYGIKQVPVDEICLTPSLLKKNR